MGESVPCVAPCASCGRTWSPSGQYPWGPAPDSPRTRTRDLSQTSYPSSSFFFKMNLIKRNKVYAPITQKKWKAAKLTKLSNFRCCLLRDICFYNRNSKYAKFTQIYFSLYYLYFRRFLPIVFTSDGKIGLLCMFRHCECTGKCLVWRVNNDDFLTLIFILLILHGKSTKYSQTLSG